MSIQHIFARQIYDSRGNPTVEVDLQTEAGNAEWDGCKYAGAYPGISDWGGTKQI